MTHFMKQTDFVDKDYVEINLDLHDKSSTSRVEQNYTLMQGNHKSRILRCNLTKGRLVPVDLSNSILTLYIKKVDMGLVMLQGKIVDAKNGIVDFALTRQALAIADEITCEVVKVGVDESTMSFPTFVLKIDKSIVDEELIESTDDFSALNDSLVKVAEWNGKFDVQYEEIGNKFQNKYEGLEREYANELTDVKNGLSETNAQLSEKIDYINIIKYKNFVIDNDWTIAITKAIDSIAFGGTIYFPSGEYNHTGFTIDKTCNFVGNNKNSTILVNIGENDGIEITGFSGAFRHIGIFGNGSGEFSENATSKKGIIIKGCGWTFDDIWMRYHGDYFIYSDMVGNVNNINICNSFFEHGNTGGLRFIQCDSNNQINGVNIDNCNIAWFNKNAVEVWGQSISVSKCTIQACKERGIVVDGSLSALGSSTTSGINITDNYFELCNKGFIYCNSYLHNGVVRYVNGLTICGNYGVYGVINNTTSDLQCYCVEIESKNFYSYENFQIGTLFYANNSFSKGNCLGVFNGNNVLSYNTTVLGNAVGIGDAYFDFYNLGMANTNFGEEKVRHIGFLDCINLKFDTCKSENIKSTQDIYFRKDYKYYKDVSFEITTDSTNYSIDFYFVSYDSSDRPIDTIMYHGTGVGNSKMNFTNQLSVSDAVEFKKSELLKVTINIYDVPSNFTINNLRMTTII